MNGTDGVNAISTTTAGFTVPAVSSSVSLTVDESTWMVVGQTVYVGNAGNYQVVSTGVGGCVLANLGYPGNASPATVVAGGQKISPSGVQGVGTGTVTSVAVAVPTGFTSTGGPVTTAGTITIGFAAAQTANNFLATPDGSAGALSLRAIVAGDIPNLPANKIATGEVAIANGGTGAATAALAMTALSPQTTKGDLIVYSGSGTGRLAAGTNGQVLTANSLVANGVDWETPANVVTNPVTRVTSTSYAMLSGDLVMLSDRSTTIASNVTLLTAPGDGRLATVKDLANNASTNNITITAGAGDTVEGAATNVINTNRGYRQLIYDAVNKNWSIIASG